jgi:hypothetical protein
VAITGAYTCRTTGGTYAHYTYSMPAEAGVAVDFQPTDIPAGNLCSAIFTTAQHTLVGTVSEEDIIAPSLNDGSIYEAIVLD